MHVHTEVFGCFNERTSDAAAGTFNGLHDTGDAVAAEVLNERFVLNTVLDGEIKSRTSTVNNVLQKIDVAQTAAGLNHVLEHEFRRVLDAFFFMKRIAGTSESPAVDGRVSAVSRHFFKQHDRSPFFFGF